MFFSWAHGHHPEDYYFLAALEARCCHVIVPQGDLSESDGMMKWYKRLLWKWKSVLPSSQCLKCRYEGERCWAANLDHDVEAKGWGV